MMRLGILNVFWFGLRPANDPLDVGFYHSAEDDIRVRDLIRSAEIEVLTAVEIVDVARLEALLKQLPGTWRLRDGEGQALASAEPAGPDGDNIQRVVVAWDDDRVELVGWGRPLAVGPRRPVVARLRHRASGVELTNVAIHPKSGNPIGWDALPPDALDHKAGVRRTELFEALANWLQSPPAELAGPFVVSGDFNSVRDSSECTALRALPGWSWPVPAFRPADADQRTTRVDPAIIDHFVLSPGLGFEGHEAIAFDLLADFPEAHPISSVVWKRTTDHRMVVMTVGEA